MIRLLLDNIAYRWVEWRTRVKYDYIDHVTIVR